MARGGSRIGAGRKRKPAELRVLEGTWRRDRDGAPPALTDGAGLLAFPEPPPHLTPRQSELWANLRQHCGGWVRPGDWIAVNGLVALVSRLRDVEAAASDEALADTANLEIKLLREIRGYLSILGLSPADRAKVAPKGGEAAPAKPSKWAGIIAGGAR